MTVPDWHKALRHPHTLGEVSRSANIQARIRCRTCTTRHR